MNDVHNSSKPFSKSSILIPKIKKKGQTPKFFDKTYITFFPNSCKKKNNSSFISDLINSSKKIVKNNSCIQLPKAKRHHYPYRPEFKPEVKYRILSSKIHSKSNLELSNISTCKSLEISKTSLISIKLGQKRNCKYF